MVTKRRPGLNGASAPKGRWGQPAAIAGAKKGAKGYLKPRTRTSLVGTTIYQPDIKPSSLGRKLLEALER
jgi:hypothetical protein